MADGMFADGVVGSPENQPKVCGVGGHRRGLSLVILAPILSSSRQIGRRRDTRGPLYQYRTENTDVTQRAKISGYKKRYSRLP